MSYSILKIVAMVFAALFMVVGSVGVYHMRKPLPKGLSYDGPMRTATNVKFLRDLTYLDSEGMRHSRQEIFDEVMSIISEAKKFILIDMFLFNSFQGAKPERTRALASELTEKLLSAKTSNPSINIILITDPINIVYGGLPSPELDKLKAGGVRVVMSRLEALRDSNPIYSAPWRVFLSHLGNGRGTRMPNPFGAGKVSIRSYLKLINFKANHRKIIVADSFEGYTALVTSANPHDGSSAHGNIALRFSGDAALDIVRTERAVLDFSGGKDAVLPDYDMEVKEVNGTTLRVLTERAIKKGLLDAIDKATKGDAIDVAVFYLSDRDIVGALIEARKRGTDMRMILDPNFDAFGHKKNGIPNRQTGRELYGTGVSLRWCSTNGEQCHAKLMLASYSDNTSTLILGSANFTRRNLQDLNLETDVELKGDSSEEVFVDAKAYIDSLWNNENNEIYTVGYDKFAEPASYKDLMYRVQEATGMGTF